MKNLACISLFTVITISYAFASEQRASHAQCTAGFTGALICCQSSKVKNPVWMSTKSRAGKIHAVCEEKPGVNVKTSIQCTAQSKIAGTFYSLKSFCKTVGGHARLCQNYSSGTLLGCVDVAK